MSGRSPRSSPINWMGRGRLSPANQESPRRSAPYSVRSGRSTSYNALILNQRGDVEDDLFSSPDPVDSFDNPLPDVSTERQPRRQASSSTATSSSNVSIFSPARQYEAATRNSSTEAFDPVSSSPPTTTNTATAASSSFAQLLKPTPPPTPEMDYKRSICHSPGPYSKPQRLRKTPFPSSNTNNLSPSPVTIIPTPLTAEQTRALYGKWADFSYPNKTDTPPLPQTRSSSRASNPDVGASSIPNRPSSSSAFSSYYSAAPSSSTSGALDNLDEEAGNANISRNDGSTIQSGANKTIPTKMEFDQGDAPLDLRSPPPPASRSSTPIVAPQSMKFGQSFFAPKNEITSLGSSLFGQQQLPPKSNAPSHHRIFGTQLDKPEFVTPPSTPPPQVFPAPANKHTSGLFSVGNINKASPVTPVASTYAKPPTEEEVTIVQETTKKLHSMSLRSSRLHPTSRTVSFEDLRKKSGRKVGKAAMETDTGVASAQTQAAASVGNGDKIFQPITGFANGNQKFQPQTDNAVGNCITSGNGNQLLGHQVAAGAGNNNQQFQFQTATGNMPIRTQSAFGVGNQEAANSVGNGNKQFQQFQPITASAFGNANQKFQSQTDTPASNGDRIIRPQTTTSVTGGNQFIGPQTSGGVGSSSQHFQFQTHTGKQLLPPQSAASGNQPIEFQSGACVANWNRPSQSQNSGSFGNVNDNQQFQSNNVFGAASGKSNFQSNIAAGLASVNQLLQPTNAAGSANGNPPFQPTVANNNFASGLATDRNNQSFFPKAKPQNFLFQHLFNRGGNQPQQLQQQPQTLPPPPPMSSFRGLSTKVDESSFSVLLTDKLEKNYLELRSVLLSKEGGLMTPLRFLQVICDRMEIGIHAESFRFLYAENDIQFRTELYAAGFCGVGHALSIGFSKQLAAAHILERMRIHFKEIKQNNYALFPGTRHTKIGEKLEQLCQTYDLGEIEMVAKDRFEEQQNQLVGAGSFGSRGRGGRGRGNYRGRGRGGWNSRDLMEARWECSCLVRSYQAVVHSDHALYGKFQAATEMYLNFVKPLEVPVIQIKDYFAVGVDCPMLKDIHCSLVLNQPSVFKLKWLEENQIPATQVDAILHDPMNDSKYLMGQRQQFYSKRGPPPKTLEGDKLAEFQKRLGDAVEWLQGTFQKNSSSGRDVPAPAPGTSAAATVKAEEESGDKPMDEDDGEVEDIFLDCVDIEFLE